MYYSKIVRITAICCLSLNVEGKVCGFGLKAGRCRVNLKGLDFRLRKDKSQVLSSSGKRVLIYGPSFSVGFAWDHLPSSPPQTFLHERFNVQRCNVLDRQTDTFVSWLSSSAQLETYLLVDLIHLFGVDLSLRTRSVPKQVSGLQLFFLPLRPFGEAPDGSRKLKRRNSPVHK